MEQNKGCAAIKNEIEIMKEMVHTNVVRYYETHETEDSVYIIMEYIEGESIVTMDTEGNSETQYAPDEILFIMKKLFDILLYFDSKKLIHRDIKPDNIMIKFAKGSRDVQQATIKVIDFGLSTFWNQ
jgi:serine/threonine protein kinase